MAQTVAVVRNTLTATLSGTTDFTKTGFGTPTAAIILMDSSNTTNNPQASGIMSVGFWDGTNVRCCAIRAEDGGATSNTQRSQDDTYGAIAPADGSNNAAFSVSNITDGIRLTMDVDNASDQRFCTVLLLAGVSAKVGTFTPNTTQNATQASASLGFAPKLVFFTCIGMGTGDQVGISNAILSFGFARDDATHRAIIFCSLDTQLDELANILYSETRCVGQISNNATQWTGEVTTFGADTFTMTTRDGGSGSDVCFFLALGGADLSIDAGTYTTRTSNGDNVIATDIAADAVLVGLSTADGTTLETGADANGIMFGLADDNGQFSHNLSVEDAAATINANSASQAAKLIDLDTSSAGTRTDMVDGTVTLNASDFTVAENPTNATARKGWWVAWGAAAGGAAALAPPLVGEGRLLRGLAAGRLVA